jgi:hypothetical protein
MAGEIFKHLTGKEVPATIAEVHEEVMRVTGLSHLPIVYRQALPLRDVSAKLEEVDRILDGKPPRSK